MLKLFPFLVFLIQLVGCRTQENNANSINVALSSKISSLDPAICFDTICGEVAYQIYEPLYQYDYLQRPYKLIPLLAESDPTIDQNGLRYTIKIKKNIQYHKNDFFPQTRTVIAQDFINQFKRVAFKPTSSNGWWLFEGKIKGLDSFRDNAKDDLSNFFTLPVEGLTAVDDHTLEIQLNAAFPQLVYALAMIFSVPVPEELIKKLKNDLNFNPIGTGPFLYDHSSSQGNNISLLRFDHYHPNFYPLKGDRYSHQHNLLSDAGKKIPFLSKITFSVMEEAQTRWLNFLKKNIDFLTIGKDHFALALDEKGKLKKQYKEQNIQIQISPTLTYWWLAFNMNDQILGKNLNLRKAIAHAVDNDKLIEIFTNNIGQKANSIYPPGIPGYDPTYVLPYQYDLDKARQYMIDAGFPDGKGLGIINYDVRGANQISRQMGEFISNELAKIGIKINVVLNTFPGFLNKAKTGQLQFWQGGWAMDYPDPENTVQLLIKKNFPPGPNTSYFQNLKIEEIYQSISSNKNIKDSQSQLKEIEDIVHQEIPWIMQFYSRNFLLYHGRIKNFRQSDLIYGNYKYIRVN